MICCHGNPHTTKMEEDEMHMTERLGDREDNIIQTEETELEVKMIGSRVATEKYLHSISLTSQTQPQITFRIMHMELCDTMDKCVLSMVILKAICWASVGGSGP